MKRGNKFLPFLGKDKAEYEYYATPPWEVANILKREQILSPVLEPCCGNGAMVYGIRLSGYKGRITATDLIDRGFGVGGLDFLSNNYPHTFGINTVIMNPPFSLVGEFTLKGLAIAKYKLILLARAQFIEGKDRYNRIFLKYPPSRIYSYSGRMGCAKEGDFSKKLVRHMAFSWFVWDLPVVNKPPTFHWISPINGGLRLL